MDAKHTATPLKQFFDAVIAFDSLRPVVNMPMSQAEIEEYEMLTLARQHAQQCLETPGFDEETLSHNIESNFPELDIETCDAIAKAAFYKLAKAGAA